MARSSPRSSQQISGYSFPRARPTPARAPRPRRRVDRGRDGGEGRARRPPAGRRPQGSVVRRRADARRRRRAVPPLRPQRSRPGRATRGRCTARRRSIARSRAPTSPSRACSPSTRPSRRCSPSASRARTGSRGSAIPTSSCASRSDFMTHLAALHRLDPARPRPPGVPAGDRRFPTLVAPRARRVGGHHRVPGRRPRSRVSGSRSTGCARNVPDYDGPVVLVQGDTGPGNFMYRRRSRRRGRRLGARAPRRPDGRHRVAVAARGRRSRSPTSPTGCDEYAALSGNEIDEARVHYYRVMAETKLLVMSHRPARCAARRDRRGRRRRRQPPHLRRAAPAAVARGAGRASSASTSYPPRCRRRRGPTEHDWLYRRTCSRSCATSSSRVSTDPLALPAREGHRADPQVPRRDPARRPVLRGVASSTTSPRCSATGRRRSTTAGRGLADAVRAGTVSPTATTSRYLWRRVARENELLRPASGVLADRHWPPLR